MSRRVAFENRRISCGYGLHLYGTGVSPVSIVLAVVVVGLVIVMAILLRTRSSDKKAQTHLEEQLAIANRKSQELEARVAELDTALTEERSRVDHERQRATTAEEATNEALMRADKADEQTRTIESDLRRKLSDPTPLGALEALRISRLWQERVPGPGEPLPVETHDNVHAALVVLAEASREESGTSVDISWLAEAPVEPAKALQIVRIAEELMASARSAD